MNHLRNKINVLAIKAFLKDGFAALMVVMLVHVHPAVAQTFTFAALDQSVTIAAFDDTEPAIAEPVPPAHEPTVQEVLLAVCEAKGYGQPCAQTLLGMLWNESSNVSTAIGDRGNARGYFQIWTKLHKISVACAEDLVCSADWTLKYMERNHYPKHVNYAIQCHNGCGFNNGYTPKAIRNGKNFWNQPLKVTQAAPIVLPAPQLAVK